MEQLKRCAQDQSGATAVEYAIIIAAVATLIAVVVVLLGGKVSSAFGDYEQSIP